MSVENKVKNLVHFITGSAGGWPDLSRAGIVGSIDYIVESGSNDIYFLEMNTNVGITGNISDQQGLYNEISNYASSQSFHTAYVYGLTVSDGRKNPSELQQQYISSSFANNNILVNFEYDKTWLSTYFEQFGLEEHSGSFHLFIDTPWYSNDNLYEFISGSLSKNNFRTLVSHSPESSSLIPLFNSSSYTPNTDYPDYISKSSSLDNGIQEALIDFYTYDNTSNSYINAVSNGNITEKFIIGSGSYSNVPHLSSGRVVYLSTPEETYILRNEYNSQRSKLYKDSGVDRWRYPVNKSSFGVSGSLVKMYDDSSKQIQDVEIGDVVKSYQPVGMSLQDGNFRHFTQETLSGSFSGSVVVGKTEQVGQSYYLINDTMKVIADDTNGVVFSYGSDNKWSWKWPFELSVNDKLLDVTGSQQNIDSITFQQGQETFYSLDVEDIDTYFSSDILVHNLPRKE
jgi:hypothetical protein|tara:strand:+ start:374 stop:1738 length:1365 start_codon:yes stop_codon:yes gene_type:complete